MWGLSNYSFQIYDGFFTTGRLPSVAAMHHHPALEHGIGHHGDKRDHHDDSHRRLPCNTLVLRLHRRSSGATGE